MGRFHLYKKKGWRGNAEENKVMVLGGKEGTLCEICEEKHSNFNCYSVVVFDELSTDDVEHCRKVAGPVKLFLMYFNEILGEGRKKER